MEGKEITETTEKAKNKKELKAKFCSLMSKIIGVVIVVGGHILMWTGKLPNATSGQICACGFTVMGIFGTVDINILIDKFTKRD